MIYYTINITEWIKLEMVGLVILILHIRNPGGLRNPDQKCQKYLVQPDRIFRDRIILNQGLAQFSK